MRTELKTNSQRDECDTPENGNLVKVFVLLFYYLTRTELKTNSQRDECDNFVNHVLKVNISSIKRLLI